MYFLYVHITIFQVICSSMHNTYIIVIAILWFNSCIHLLSQKTHTPNWEGAYLRCRNWCEGWWRQYWIILWRHEEVEEQSLIKRRRQHQGSTKLIRRETMIRNITIRKYELILHITIVCMHDVSQICMVLCIYLCYRLYNISIIAGTSTRSFDTTAQQWQRWAERAQAGQVMAWVLPDHRTHREGSVSTV